MAIYGERHPEVYGEKVNNGNSTEWSAIWSEIIHVISKMERARSASSIWTHMYDFRPKLHDTKFNNPY